MKAIVIIPLRELHMAATSMALLSNTSSDLNAIAAHHPLITPKSFTPVKALKPKL